MTIRYKYIQYMTTTITTYNINSHKKTRAISFIIHLAPSCLPASLDAEATPNSFSAVVSTYDCASPKDNC